MADYKSSGLNVTILEGRLTRDPELRYTQNGKAVCSITIAHDVYKGQGQKEAIFIRVTCWDKVAEAVADMRKGQPVLAQGRFSQENYEKDGQKVQKTGMTAFKVQSLTWPDDSNLSQDNYVAPTPPIEDPIPEDDIPF
jgi:single-strand DNA-binding protein